ncbi:MAG: hypothetical protein FGM46_08135 [Ferruginibacter sp.]|nr:hypothetical protein [Ferruginibacter sp.]
MSLDDFQLPMALIPGLYQNCFVDIGNADSVQTKPETNERVTLGKNEKKILLMVNDSESLHLNEKDFQFLSGILNACKLNMNDVALLNANNYKKTDFTSIKAFLNPLFLIVFGLTNQYCKPNIESDNYEVRLMDNFSFLSTPSLRLISENTEEKKMLWSALKKLFAI